ncbi:response regulator transcription factor [Rhizobium sp. S152]|uniref:response regulator transcription factor n=1 Tax=Rhizobium sp. S152 TaxID=3055038 RepID=UPI0025AA2EDA|nr:response regulator transcription factor [Rhizobium sp. S152]MDM9625404.1 response regulator transcription factor [Rhizobium sp. S152]
MSIPARFQDKATVSRHIEVVFLEDDNVLRQGVTDFLRLNSIVVTEVASVTEFTKAIARKQFDVALLDIGLPDGNGIELTQQLQAQIDIGIIILTARAGRDDRLKGYNAGADVYLTKPVDGAELVLAIRNLARRIKGRAPSPTNESAPAWRLDIAGHRLVSPSGDVIRLSGREAQLLKRMAQADGSVVTRREIAEAIGYENLAADSRSIDAVLRRLRQKAKSAHVELPVHAVHAQGFRFAAQVRIS